MSRYCLTKVYDIKSLSPGQILFYETSDDTYEVVKVGPVYVELKPMQFATNFAGINVREIYVSNEYIKEYFLLPRL
jgi:hypothetical protein